MHVDFNSESGFTGLPAEWEVLLKSSAISKEEVLKNPQETLQVLEFHDKGYKPSGNQANVPPPKIEKKEDIKLDKDEQPERKNEEPQSSEPQVTPKVRKDKKKKKSSDMDWIDPGDPTKSLLAWKKLVKDHLVKSLKVFTRRPVLLAPSKLFLLVVMRN